MFVRSLYRFGLSQAHASFGTTCQRYIAPIWLLVLRLYLAVRLTLHLLEECTRSLNIVWLRQVTTEDWSILRTTWRFCRVFVNVVVAAIHKGRATEYGRKVKYIKAKTSKVLVEPGAPNQCDTVISAFDVGREHGEIAHVVAAGKEDVLALGTLNK